MLLREWKASKIHPLCHVTLQNTCVLYRINHLCSYLVPQPRGDGAQPWFSQQSSSWSGDALPVGLVGAERQRAGLRGWVMWLLLSQLPNSCSTFSTHSLRRKDCFWWHTSLLVYAVGHMGSDGLITLEEYSPHMHLKKERKKKKKILFSRGCSNRFFLELDFWTAWIVNSFYF